MTVENPTREISSAFCWQQKLAYRVFSWQHCHEIAVSCTSALYTCDFTNIFPCVRISEMRLNRSLIRTWLWNHFLIFFHTYLLVGAASGWCLWCCGCACMSVSNTDFISQRHFNSLTTRKRSWRTIANRYCCDFFIYQKPIIFWLIYHTTRLAN